jgi:hypothetical protein
MRYRGSLLAVSLILATGCSSAPAKDELLRRYAAEKSTFASLSQMITADFSDSAAPPARFGKQKPYTGLGIGLDNIGDYWKSGSKWNRSGEIQPLSLDDVLQGVGIAKERYTRYIALLEKIGAERITYSLLEGHPPAIEILVFRAGLSISGSSTVYLKSSEPPQPFGDESSAKYCKVDHVDGDWYVVSEGS